MRHDVILLNPTINQFPADTTTTAPNDVKASFASVTGSNLDMAPPSASPQPVPQQPVFDEETVMLENARREIRRWRQKEPGEGMHDLTIYTYMLTWMHKRNHTRNETNGRPT